MCAPGQTTKSQVDLGIDDFLNTVRSVGMSAERNHILDTVNHLIAARIAIQIGDDKFNLVQTTLRH
jgi:UDP-3-O-acyl-N-acetylglucosamine deacetylase